MGAILALPATRPLCPCRVWHCRDCRAGATSACGRVDDPPGRAEAGPSGAGRCGLRFGLSGGVAPGSTALATRRRRRRRRRVVGRAGLCSAPRWWPAHRAVDVWRPCRSASWRAGRWPRATAPDRHVVWSRWGGPPSPDRCSALRAGPRRGSDLGSPGRSPRLRRRQAGEPRQIACPCPPELLRLATPLRTTSRTPPHVGVGSRMGGSSVRSNGAPPGYLATRRRGGSRSS